MVEKRESIRVNPPEGSFVTNQLNQKKIARIVDISESGFLLVGRNKIKSGMIFQLEVVIAGMKNAHLAVGAECIWADLQTSGITFAGFHIIDISADNQAKLNEVIEQLTAH